MKQIFCVLCTLFVLLACSKDAEETPVGGIAGSVADKTTGEPVATVNVTLAPGGKSTITGSDGTFAFTVLDPGNYSINISKEGYNSNHASVNVKAGQQTATHLLIERIPSIITADRNMLDFGENASLNTLSFNIVNSSYENLEWNIEENCRWITEVKPNKGTLPYGKTETIVVVIDRNELEEGANETVIVVRSSSKGSSEVKITATGSVRKLPALNVLEATEISTSSAILHGEITSPGNPAYTERGFVYHTETKPTLENSLGQPTAPVTNDTAFSCSLKNLSLGTTYYVRAYAKNRNGLVYSSNEISFTTGVIPPQISIQETTDVNVSAKTAMLHGTIINVGDPAYTEHGFVYGTISNPTVESTKVVVAGNGTGAFSAKISELSLDQTYYVRAYAVSEAGTVYSSTEVSFTMSTILPELSVQETTDINVSAQTAMLHGTIISVGDPAYTEHGFVYGTINNPTVESTKVVVAGNGTGAFSAKISELSLDQTYYVRAYARNNKGIAYSTNEVHFTIRDVLPQVTTQKPTEVDMAAGTAVLHGTVETLGEPIYTERGFVYGTMPTPTIYDNKIVSAGTGISGAFSSEVATLPVDHTYYVRAYATNRAGTAYGESVAVELEWMKLSSAGLAVQKKDIGQGNWDSVNAMCENSTLGGYTDWRLPSKEELMTLYTNRTAIGDFGTSTYWASSFFFDGKYIYRYFVNFKDGGQGLTGWVGNVYSARCVRTLK